MSKPLINVADLALNQSSRGTRFSVETGEIATELGLHGLGAMLHIVPPGKTAFPFHRHHGCDEMFLILSGTGDYRLGDKLLPVKAGDCLGAPAGGEAHQIINSGTEPLRYIGFSNNTNADVCEYPDTGRISVNVGSDGYHHLDGTFKKGGKLSPFGYWEGEDTGEAK